MKRTSYFEIYWIDAKGKMLGRYVIQLFQEENVTFGGRIEELTQEVRSVNLTDGIRLRTKVHMSCPSDANPIPLGIYLWSDGRMNRNRFKRHLTCRINGSEPHHFQMHTGIPVVGQDFVGRENTFTQIIDIIRSGSCHLSAPRRYGKTSILYRIEEVITNTVFVDLCEVRSLNGFMRILIRRLMADPNTHTLLEQIDETRNWPTTDSSNEAVSEAFKRFDRRGINHGALVQKMLQVLSEAGFVLLLDEFSIFLRSMLEDQPQAVGSFLRELKQIRLAGKPLRCIFAGSAGLSAYILFHKLEGYFDDLTVLELPPLSTPEAETLVEELFYGAGKTPSPQVVSRVIECIGAPIPYFLQTLVHETVAQIRLEETPEPEDVTRAYLERLLGPTGNIFFRDFLLREKAYPKACRTGASAILHALAETQGPMAEEDLSVRFNAAVGNTEACNFADLMTCLQEDYDLIYENNFWVMRSKVLAERWRLGEPWLMGDK